MTKAPDQWQRIFRNGSVGSRPIALERYVGFLVLGKRAMQDNEPLFAEPSRAPAPLPQVQFAGPSASRRPRTLRTICIALGCVLGVTLLIAGAIYSPSRYSTRVDRGKRLESPTNHAAGAPVANSLGSSSPADSPSDSSVSSGPLRTDAPQSTSAAQALQRTDRRNPITQTPYPSDLTFASGGSPEPQPQSSVADDSAITAELQEMEDEADKLNARATAVSRSLDRLRQQQNASGLELRADISSTQDRMQRALGLADSALQQRNPVGARKYLSQAESELSILERFLNQ